MATDPNLDDLTVAQLRERAGKLNIAGRSSMNKSELAQAVGAADRSDLPDVGEDSTIVREFVGDATAPSIGPNTMVEHEAPESRLARGEQSQVDAMGQDKRRSVMGHSYGPSLGRQAMAYGTFFAVVIALVIGASIAIKELDKPDPSRINTAPWAAADAPNQPPTPIDFPRAITP